MRIFIGIDVDQIASDVAFFQSTLTNYLQKYNQTRKDNLHLTLYFIGDLASPDFLYNDLANVIFKPFIIKTDGLAAFNKPDGDIIYLSILNTAPLDNLYTQIITVLSKYMNVSKNTYTPHITLFRKAKYAHMIPLSNTDFYREINISSFHVYESKQIDGQLCYVKLKTFQTK